MSNFLQTVKNSIYSPEFYKRILKAPPERDLSSSAYKNTPKEPFKKGFLYFLLLSLVLTTVHVSTFTLSLLINVPKEIQKFTSEVIDCYPKDLEIKIKNGVATTSANQPYKLPSCPALAGNEGKIVIDTATPFSPEKFKEYNAALWITKDSAVYQKDQNETRSYSFSQIKDFTLNKLVITSFYNSFSPWIKFVGPILLLLSFLGIYLLFNFKLIYLFFFAAIVWLISRLFKHDLTYNQSYKVGLYAITLGLILELALNITHRWTNFNGFPFMFTFVSLAVVVVNLFLSHENTSAKSEK